MYNIEKLANYFGLNEGKDWARVANEEVRELANIFSWDSVEDGEHNGRWDAIRHCTGGCIIAKKMGYTKAYIIGLGHEIQNVLNEPTQDIVQESKMDMFNNKVGFSLSKKVKTIDDCVWECYNAEVNGKLICKPPLFGLI